MVLNAVLFVSTFQNNLVTNRTNKTSKMSCSCKCNQASAPPEDMEEIICNCFQVTRGTIVDAIKGGATTVDAVGDATSAGTGCGGCRGKIAAIIEQTKK